MFPLEKVMNASEKRILKLAIILFTIGLVFRYLPWGLPSIESFEVGDAIVVANSSPPAPEIASLPAMAGVDSGAGFVTNLDKVSDSASLASTEKFPRKPKKTVSFPLHVNTASADDLCALKGVGPKLAEKIIVHRNTFGPFKGASDLKKVHGIGKKKLEMMLQFIIFD
ncbi:MAG: helix-hairpin-helix domain-containing protein [Fibrobacter sp.]|nr:helix-hairpin-helix domain-containing protein [Fibrobacter sp.]